MSHYVIQVEAERLLTVDISDATGTRAKVSWDLATGLYSDLTFDLASIDKAYRLVEILSVNVPLFDPDASVNRIELIRSLSSLSERIEHLTDTLSREDGQQSLGLF